MVTVCTAVVRMNLCGFPGIYAVSVTDTTNWSDAMLDRRQYFHIKVKKQ